MPGIRMSVTTMGKGLAVNASSSFAGTLGGVDVIAEIPDQGPEDMADAGFIINEQNANGSVHAVSLASRNLFRLRAGNASGPVPVGGARSGRDPRAG